jgi:hypothetical protein
LLGVALGLCVGAALGTIMQVLTFAEKIPPFFSLTVLTRPHRGGTVTVPWNTKELCWSPDGNQLLPDTRYV